MLSKEGLEKKIIKGSNEIMFFFFFLLENDIFADEVYLNCEIEKYKNIYYNYEEASSILAVHYINNLLSIYHKGGDIVHNKYAAKLSIMDYDDEMIKKILDFSIFDLNFNDYWDAQVQELYRLMGFDNELPKHNEIRKLDVMIQNKRRDNADIVEILELQKEMDLKKCALGELENQFDDDMPIIFSDDVIENYDNYILENKLVNKVRELNRRMGK